MIQTHGEQESNRRHGRDQVALVTLVRNAKKRREHEDPDPEQAFHGIELLPPPPRIPNQGDDGGSQQAGVEGIGNQNPPDAGRSPEKIQEVTFIVVIEFPDVLTEHKIREDLPRMRIEEEPEREGHHGGGPDDGNLPGVLDEEEPPAPFSPHQVPEGDRGNKGDDQRERLVEQRETGHETQQQGPESTPRQNRLAVEQQESERREKKERLGGAREKDPAVTIGGEEA